jgi:hypothetical protein
MMERLIRPSVAFVHPFELNGLDGPQPLPASNMASRPRQARESELVPRYGHLAR